MRPSILQKTKKCWACGRRYGLERHHVFYGSAYRQMSEKYGLTVWLCVEHHRGKTGVHGYNQELRQRLMRYAQRKFEESHSRAEFMRIFGRNRIDAETEEDDEIHIPRKELADKDPHSDVFPDDSGIRGWDLKRKGRDE